MFNVGGMVSSLHVDGCVSTGRLCMLMGGLHVFTGDLHAFTGRLLVL